MRVSTNQFRAAVGVIALAGLAISTPTLAAPQYCAERSTTNNYMAIDDTLVTDCLGAGVGNLTGESHNDLFLNGATGDGYASAGKSDGSNPFNITFTSSRDGRSGNRIGTFTLDASFWDYAISGAIGFKFGTGNFADEWFVFELAEGVTSGSFTFYNIGGTGGGLSHVNLYRVPEPSGLVMLGLGVVGAGFVRRRTKAA